MNQSYAPAPDILILREDFRALLRPGAAVTCIATGFQFTEGPVWLADQGCLVFSDIPAGILYRWEPGVGHAVWRKPSHHANGNTTDLQGRLISCQHGTRTVTRTDRDGRVTTLARSFRGKPLNSPNDVVVKRDGTIWFTDPPYGIRPDQVEQAANRVYRLDPGAAEPVAVCEDFTRPNGLCFSPDERLLYVANSDGPFHHVRRFAVGPGNTLSGGEVFRVIDPGVPDGMRVDADGRLWSTAGDGVQVFAPDGAHIGTISTPQVAANCAFGGPGLRTLFITAVSSVWALELNVAGAR
jgi:gluconolactonase